jgi:hypothetical protein
MSRDVYLLTIEESASVRRVTTTKVDTSGAQPMPRVYGSLVLLTNGALDLLGRLFLVVVFFDVFLLPLLPLALPST